MNEQQLPPISPTKELVGPTRSKPEGDPPKQISDQELLAPGPIYLPGVSSARNPILGTMSSYTRYRPVQRRPVATYKTHYQRGMHQHSMFDDTSCRPSYYVIHPDWTSEVPTISRMSTKTRGHFSWDSRPAFHPLRDYVIPLLEKRRSHDDRINEAVQSAREPRSYMSAYPKVNAALHSRPPSAARAAIPRTSLKMPGEQFDTPRPPTGTKFYKSLLEREILTPRREATWI